MIDPRFYENRGPFTLVKLCEIGGCSLSGKDKSIGNRKINGVAPLNTAGSEEISFLDNPKYLETFKLTKAGACIIHEKHQHHAPADVALLISNNPYLSFAMVTDAFHPVKTTETGVSPKANIDTTAKIGKNCTIEPGSYIGPDVKIGNDTYIGPNSVISRGVTIGKKCYIGNLVSLAFCDVGDNVILHNGVRIGQDGFGFATSPDGKHVKVPQVGRVIINNDVEIGANSCIDRGSGPDSVIGEGTKIDNLVQIGHNVQIGKGCIIVSQVGISGSTKLGDYVVLAGQVGLAGHLKIGAGARIAAQSGVMHDIPPGKNYGGYPAVPIKQWHRQNVTVKNITNKTQGNNDDDN